MSEKDYLGNIVGIFVMVLAIQAILFSFFYKIGILIVFGLLFYFLIFMRRDKKIEKQELDEMLYYEKSWIECKQVLSKDIP